MRANCDDIGTQHGSTQAQYKSWISMKFFRYRRPSSTTILGMRKAIKTVKTELNITAVPELLGI